MRYYLDEHATDLNALQERLQSTDLIPSQEPLLEGMADKMTSIEMAGMTSLSELRYALKTEKSLTELSKNSGVDTDYLRLLRRTINGFFPKPKPLKDIDWLGSGVIRKLNQAGIKNTRHVFEAAFDGTAAFAKQTGIDQEDAQTFLAVADVCRIQWVSPTFARVLIAAGLANAAAVANSSPQVLFEAIKKANENGEFFKGTVGLRDIKRLVAAARYVP